MTVTQSQPVADLKYFTIYGNLVIKNHDTYWTLMIETAA